MGLMSWWRGRKKKAAIKSLREEVISYIQALEARAPEMKIDVLRSHVRALMEMCSSLGFDYDDLLPRDSPLRKATPRPGALRRIK